MAIAALLMTACSSHGTVTEEKIDFAGASFRVVKLAPEDVQLVWKDAEGKPFRSFDRVQTAYAAQGKTVTFLINAGIYEPGSTPSGLHIENGKIIRSLNLNDAPGNFF